MDYLFMLKFGLLVGLCVVFFGIEIVGLFVG